MKTRKEEINELIKRHKENQKKTEAILVKENLEDGKIWSLYEDTENMDYICWTKTKKEALQYAKENNIKITN